MKAAKQLVELNQKHKDAWENYIKRGKKIDKQIDELEKKRKKLSYRSDLRTLFQPFAWEIKRALGADDYEWYGPFGLDCSQSIYFKKDGDKCITTKGNVLGSICFISFNGGYAIRDERKNTGEYAKGTLGEVNGMNHPIIEFTEEMNSEWLIKWAKKNK